MVDKLVETVAITGANGFIGSALTRRLVEQGIAVRAIVRNSADLSRLEGIPVTVVEANVLEPRTLRRVFAAADGVIHAVGKLGQFGVPEDSYHELHVGGTRNVLEAILALDEQPRILYVSSPGVLGPVHGELSADETFPLVPGNAYERSKAAAEMMVQRYCDRLPIVIARPEFVYGPGDLHVLGLFKAVQNGQFFYIDGGLARCHPTYVADAADGMVKALLVGKPGEIYHITGPNPITFFELGRTIAQVLGVRRPFVTLSRGTALRMAGALERLSRRPPLSRDGVAFFADDRHFSWEKARRELDYAPQIDWRSGAALTAQWYQQQGLL
ncbi:MAG: NAD-dependent epimerase/dehydratase family protein [Anaerolineae bacterium]|nr:NAD-dependent epimerase/dehydratase family protein [Anaerolineae bacterium]